MERDDYDRELSWWKVLLMLKNMAEYFALKKLPVDLIVASPASRTKTTAEIFAKALKYNKTIMLNEVLYMAFVNELLETIGTFDTVDSKRLGLCHNLIFNSSCNHTQGAFKEKFQNGCYNGNTFWS